MFANILIPTDGSAGASRGAEYGLDIAAKYGATVHVLYVIDEAVRGETPGLSTDELAFERWEEEAEDAIDAVVERAEEVAVDVVTECVRGQPYRAILDYADAHDVDLIVMGLHGRSEIRRPLIGSTTNRVLRSAKVPVLPV